MVLSSAQDSTELVHLYVKAAIDMAHLRNVSATTICLIVKTDFAAMLGHFILPNNDTEPALFLLMVWFPYGLVAQRPKAGYTRRVARITRSGPSRTSTRILGPRPRACLVFIAPAPVPWLALPLGI